RAMHPPDSSVPAPIGAWPGAGRAGARLPAPRLPRWRTARCSTREAARRQALQALPEQPMRKLVVAFHSGYGHTRKVAEAVVDGAASVAGVEAGLLDLGAIDDAGWRRLAEADAIVFGAPTYMGGPSAQFKACARSEERPGGGA